MRAEGGFFNDVNPDSERVYPNALVERGIGELWPQIQRGAVPADARFQALRVGYFVSPSLLLLIFVEYLCNADADVVLECGSRFVERQSGGEPDCSPQSEYRKRLMRAYGLLSEAAVRILYTR